jgi:hypothetical protein
MKGYLLPLFAIAGLISACQNNTINHQKADSVINAEKETITASKGECYLYAKEKDTIALSLNKTGNKITGDLTYNLFQKDRNYGTITGKMKGDTLLIDYVFDSEGMHSSRQVVFLKKNNQLIEGFGDVEEKNGEVIFKDLKALKFDNSIVLNKTNCD